MTSIDNTTVTSNEWRFVWLVILAVMVVTTLPYIYGALSSPADKQFMGLMYNVPDHGQYLSWWRSFQSSFLVPNKLTPEPNRPFFFNLMWWLLAQVSRFTGLDYPWIYQGLRWIAGIILLVAVYRLAAVFFADVPRRRTALLLVALGSGLGWLIILLKYTLLQGITLYPLLIFAAEPNYFLCLLGSPHFALAAGLIALTFEQIFRAWKENRIRPMVIAGLIALALGWMHAYDLIILYGITGVFFLVMWAIRHKFPTRFFWGIVLFGLLSFSGAVYSYLLTTLDPLWKEVLAQFSNSGSYTPLPPYLLVMYGIPLFLAIAGLVKWSIEKHWSDERLILATWFIAGFLLLYIPTDYQIHMLNSWQIPVGFLATAFLFDVILPALAKARPLAGLKPAQWVPIALVLLVLPTNLYLWSWRFTELSRHTYPYYLEKGYIAVMDWLRVNSRPDEVVLSSETVGQYVPAISGNTAFLAHWAETVRYYDKREQVKQFFDPSAPDSIRVQTVSAFKVDYVLYGPAEQALGIYPPASLPWLSPVFHSGPVTVYKVIPDRLAGVQ